MNYAQFQKPSRYINHEFNVIKKTNPDISVALAFPDLYEVGMSHIGLKILYEIINSLDYCSAERVFMPAPDKVAFLKKNNIQLTSLETKTPLSLFDLIGFSLQYELAYTTLLEMLSLASIPIMSQQRFDNSQYPIIIAGGPCAVNPLPMSPFIDAFFIGEAEESIVELTALLKEVKGLKREDVLKSISQIDGFYVPMLHGKNITITRRIVKDLDNSPYPTKPIVPYMSVVHDRIAIEISRGCPRGCRFCQAGVIYRPFRERKPDKIFELALDSLKNTGHDTLSLSSLSAGDCSSLLKTMKILNEAFSGKNISLSLPSLRVGSVTKDILKALKAVRKTGYTIAPEAATDRLRSVINKDFTNQEYEQALKDLFDEGWLNLKLYFMIGLPTERQEDIIAIPKMAQRALQIAKERIKRFVNVSVTVSPFIPKPHTPFQWYGQIPFNEMTDKLNFLRQRLANRRIKYKGHLAEMSRLEAFIARGNEETSKVIKRAWELGAILDGWSEYFDYSLWQMASQEIGIDIDEIAEKSFNIDEKLPWDFIDIGVDKEFIKAQYETSLKETFTPSCKDKCSLCGLKCGNYKAPDDINQAFNITTKASNKEKKLKMRICYSKISLLKFLSHLELTHTILRALRRADVDTVYSAGFHPSPLVSFGPPLNVGVAGMKEFFDMEVFAPFDIKLTMEKLNNTLPDGISINAISEIPLNSPSLTNIIKRYDYLIKDCPPTNLQEIMDDSNQWTVQRQGKDIDLKLCFREININTDTSVELSLVDTDTQKARLADVVNLIFKKEISHLDITRTALYGFDKGWYEPL